MTNAELLLAATLALPLAMLAACLSRRVDENACPRCWRLAPLPALAAALVAPDGSALVLPEALLGLTFVLDGPAPCCSGLRPCSGSRGGRLCPCRPAGCGRTAGVSQCGG